MADRHYDGDDPNVPLPEDHFTPEQRKAAEQLGDGSPGLDRQDTTDADDANSESDSGGVRRNGSGTPQRSR